MDLREIGWRGGERIHLAWDRDHWLAVVNVVMNLQVMAPRNWIVRTEQELAFALASEE
jgi:hypothetical protein